MIVQCEKCNAPYQVEEEQIGDQGLAMECTSCGYQFRVIRKVFFLAEKLENPQSQKLTPTTPATNPSPNPDDSRPQLNDSVPSFADEKEISSGTHLKSSWEISYPSIPPQDPGVNKRIVRHTIHRPDLDGIGKTKNLNLAFLIILLVGLSVIGWSHFFPDHFQAIKGKFMDVAEMVPAIPEGPITISPKAKQLYLKGRGLSVFDTAEKYKEAVKLYQEAIQIEPNYAAAYGALAETSLEIAEYYILEDKSKDAREWLDESLKAGTRAITLDSKNLEAYRAISGYERLQGNFVESQRQLQQAMTIDPHNVDVHVSYARMFLSKKGLETTAEEYLEKALKMDERSIRANRYMAVTLDRLGKFSLAKDYWQKVLDLSNNHDQAQFEIVRLSALTRGLSKMEKAKNNSKDPPEPVAE